MCRLHNTMDRLTMTQFINQNPTSIIVVFCKMNSMFPFYLLCFAILKNWFWLCFQLYKFFWWQYSSVRDIWHCNVNFEKFKTYCVLKDEGSIDAISCYKKTCCHFLTFDSSLTKVLQILKNSFSLDLNCIPGQVDVCKYQTKV